MSKLTDNYTSEDIITVIHDIISLDKGGYEYVTTGGDYFSWYYAEECRLGEAAKVTIRTRKKDGRKFFLKAAYND